MKRAVLSLLLLATLGSAGCTTLANRRDLFRPNPPEGPYTDKLHEGPISHSRHGAR